MKRINRTEFFNQMAKKVTESPARDRCSKTCRLRSGCEEKNIKYCPQAEWRKHNTTKAERRIDRLTEGLMGLD